MAENINIDFMPNRKTADIQRVGAVEDYLKLFTDRAKFCFSSIYDEFSDVDKRLQYLEKFSLATPSSVDLVVENAVILQEHESQQVINNFTKTHYVKGNNIGYGGIGNNFVIGGYIAYSDITDHPEELWYSEINFPKGFRDTNETMYYNVKFYIRILSVSSSFIYFQAVFSADDEVIYTSDRFAADRAGLALTFTNIYAPDSDFEYGSADIRVEKVANRYYQSGNLFYIIRIPFQSEAEYNAAVGLTNTPIELIKLQDFQYLVPESQIIVDKELSPDSDNVIANSTVAKALELKADKETVETLSLVVESKADIIELDALSQKVEGKADAVELEALSEIVDGKADSATVSALSEAVDGKADSTEVQSIAQAVEGKAESSDLTAHTGNIDNPHEVTKEQIGLGKVENKSSAEILSELKIQDNNNYATWKDKTLATLPFNVLRDIISVDTENYHTTTASIAIKPTISGYQDVLEIPVIPVLQEEKLLISYWFKTSEQWAGYYGNTKFVVLDANGTFIDQIAVPDNNAHTEWTRLEKQVVLSAVKTPYVKVIFRVQPYDASIAAESILWIDDISINKNTLQLVRLEERVATLEAAMLSLNMN